MNNDIKEILSKMERLIVYGQYNAYYVLEKQLLDYITNLQQEINKLTAESTEWESKCYDLQKENERLKENKLTPDELVNLLNQELIKQRDDYKSRCEKALDKLYCYGEVFDSKILQQFQKEMENILNGGDKE